MELTEARKAELLAYCRIDAEDLSEAESGLLESFFHAAVDYVGIAVPTEAGRLAKFNLVVNAMILDSWERRDMTITSTVAVENPALRRIINQLKLSEPVSNSDTSKET